MPAKMDGELPPHSLNSGSLFNDTRRLISDTARQARTEYNVSQEDFAQVVNLDKTTVMEFECGRGDPLLSTVVRILSRLGWKLVVVRK